MTRETFRSRIRALRKQMAREDIRSLLILQRENVRYLTGFTGSAGIVVATRRSLHLITDFRYQLQAQQEAPGTRVIMQKGDWAGAVRSILQKQEQRIAWCDEASISLERITTLKKQGISVRGCKDPLAQQRQVKDGGELRCIRLAIRRAEESFRQFKRWLRPGMSERAAALKLELLIREAGARRPAFDIIVASGRNGAKPHAVPTDRMIRPGDLVTVDFGAEAGGYFCDITRTFCMGEPTPRQQEIHALVLDAQERAVSSIRPAAACREIDAAARKTISAQGQGKRFGHATGHGIGLLVHEGPSLSPLSKDVIREGMVVTVEPGVYIPGWGGVRIEDMFLVTKTGVQRLTTLPRSLSGREQ